MRSHQRVTLRARLAEDGRIPVAMGTTHAAWPDAQHGRFLRTATLQLKGLPAAIATLSSSIQRGFPAT